MGELFDAFFDAIAWVLSLCYSIWPSYGGAIILLTLIVMVVMTPLTLKGTRSMMAMQRMQPEMKRIQERYKDDREKLNEELLKFYKENNINPLGGCLPIVLQLPVFIVLFQVLRGLTRRVTDAGIQLGWTAGQAGQGEALTSAPEEVTEQPFDPEYLDEKSDLYQSLSGSTEMNWLGIDLSSSASDALGEGFLTALPYLVLIGIVAASGWYQQKQTMARSSSAQTDQQKMIGRVMLFFLPVISFTLPAGIVLYFVVSNLYRIGQQAYITRSMFSDKEEPIPAVSAKAGKGGKVHTVKGVEKSDQSTKAEKATAAGKGAAGKGGSGKTSRPSKKGGRTTGGKASGSSRKTYSSDPRDRRRGRSGRDEVAAEPRPRKKKRK